MTDPLAQWRADAETVIREHVQDGYGGCRWCVRVGYPCAPVIQARRVLALVDVVELTKRLYHQNGCPWITACGDVCTCGVNDLRDARTALGKDGG